MGGQTYCCEANATEPMLGTSDVVDVWLLLEYRSVWKAKALLDNDLSQPVLAWLSNGVATLREQGLRPRLQLIRQPEIDRPDVRLLAYHEGVLREFGAGSAGYDDLIRTPIATLIGNRALGTTIDAPQYFVCTNGLRDRCCARFGLPAYARLRELVGERAWQTTHLGGHRFAPNVLVLPQGVLYGRVTPQDAEAFVSKVESGEVPIAQLRGRPCHAKPVQAAEGLAGRVGLELLDVVGDENASTVTFADASDLVTVAVRRSTQPLWVTASCGDEECKAVYPFATIPANEYLVELEEDR